MIDHRQAATKKVAHTQHTYTMKTSTACMATTMYRPIPFIASGSSSSAGSAFLADFGSLCAFSLVSTVPPLSRPARFFAIVSAKNVNVCVVQSSSV